MAGGEPRFGTTATYMRRHDHRAMCLSIEIDRLHDRLYNEYQVFSAASVRKWSKFGLDKRLEKRHRQIPWRSHRNERRGDSSLDHTPRVRSQRRHPGYYLDRPTAVLANWFSLSPEFVARVVGGQEC